MNGRIKQWGIIGGKFRSSDHEKHARAFRAICNVTQIMIEFDTQQAEEDGGEADRSFWQIDYYDRNPVVEVEEMLYNPDTDPETRRFLFQVRCALLEEDSDDEDIPGPVIWRRIQQ